jgi:hypothetical protein
VQLSITDLGFPSIHDASLLFHPAFFPSLRALALGPCRQMPAYTLFFPEPPKAFLEQLDVLQLKWNCIGLIPLSLFSSSTPTLYTYSPILDSFRLQLLVTAAPRHFRIIPHTHTDMNWQTSLSTAREMLSNLSLLVASPSRPLSLHLPVFWRTVDMDNCLETGEAVILIKACGKNAVEIVWCAERQEMEYAISREFWKYGKRLKTESGSA